MFYDQYYPNKIIIKTDNVILYTFTKTKILFIVNFKLTILIYLLFHKSNQTHKDSYPI